MRVRTPAVAGHFYPASDRACRSEIEACLSTAARLREAMGAGEGAGELRKALAEGTEQAVGGIVPHAGWMCSGAVAAEVIAELSRRPVETFVVFGAAHRLMSSRAVVDGCSAWATPLGEIAIDEQLASAIHAVSEDIEEDPEPHQAEHSIEVQVPFIQHLCPSARLLPILVPHVAPAPAIGLAVVEQARLLERNVVFLGSSDLTHYGPRYGFTPRGSGPAGLDWARQVNDRGIIDLMCRMEADRIMPEVRRSQNACGAGAIAATIAACRRMGATHGAVLRHTTSEQVLRDRYGPMTDAVGYAGIVFARPAV